LPDPESYKWHLFDAVYQKKLDTRKYVSLSRDLREEVQAADHVDSTANIPPTTAGHDSHATTKTIGQKFDDTQDLEFDEVPSDEEDADIPEGSLFDYGMPGVLTKDEVNRLDLNHWRLVVRNTLVELEVHDMLSDAYVSKTLTDFQDLRGWEDWQIDDPGSIKGIAAELMAATGPELLQNSALVLF
jgi:arginyl-tRNA---protein transferase